VRQHGTVVLAEGYMDVIALAQAGFANAVAPLGTAVSEAQLGLLWQLADEPVVCLDGDEAGLRAAHRLIERALPVLSPGKSLQFAFLPRGQDPDSILRRRGRDFLAKVIGEAVPLHELLWNRETATRSLHVPQQRLALEKRFRELAATIPDRALSKLFLDAFFKRMHLALRRAKPQTRNGPSLIARDGGPGVGARRLAAFVAKPELAAERELIGPVLLHPQLLHEVEEEFAGITFSDGRLDRVQQEILSWYADRGAVEPDGLVGHLTAVGLGNLVERLSFLPTWYRKDAEVEVVLEKWRARCAEHRDLAALRMGKLATSGAMAELREEAGKFRRELDRLVNEAPAKRTRLDHDV
jgi:DNA primase